LKKIRGKLIPQLTLGFFIPNIMAKFILGKKVGMSQIFKENGTVVPVTVVEAGPIFVTQIRTEEKDGYNAVQVAYGKKNRITKPLKGHIKKSQEAGAEISAPATSVEFRMDNTESFKVGDKINVSIFEVGDKIKVSGISRSKGFQGVVKRHGFAGAPASHGHKHVARSGGSIGQRFPQHTLKGMKMPGRDGGIRVTVSGLKVVGVDFDKSVIFIKGAIPGRRGSILSIKG